jgi:hypothetical protein
MAPDPWLHAFGGSVAAEAFSLEADINIVTAV